MSQEPSAGTSRNLKGRHYQECRLLGAAVAQTDSVSGMTSVLGREGYEPMGGDNQLDHVIAQPLADGQPRPKSRAFCEPAESWHTATLTHSCRNAVSGRSFDMGGQPIQIVANEQRAPPAAGTEQAKNKR
jgi:hypothetical protein